MIRSALWVATLLLSAPASAEAQQCAAPAELGDGWAVAEPGRAGLDPSILCQIAPRIEHWKWNVHAVVVAHAGKLVYEHYFSGRDEILGQDIGEVAYDASKLHDERSISKSVTSLVVGIAFDRGWLTDLDAPVLSFFPEYADLRTPEKDRITLRHLLTMSAGFAWDESMPYSDPRNSERPMDDAADPYRYVLSQPLVDPPGRFYNYCGCSAALLGAILKKVTGKPFEALVRQELLAPLGIGDPGWDPVRGRFPNGDVMPHAGLRLRPRDLAKIGQLVLDRGEWRGRQIVSSEWIAQSTAPQINGEGLFFYGYQWWLGRSLIDRRAMDWIAGIGWGGQRLYIVPDRQVVVAFNAGMYKSGPQGYAGNSVLNREVLPAIKP
ncbi:MAG TPA: serine hydrolase [Stellaceae bacterium]|nr:serine hydrolase [Stellaceae bacterium]